MPIALLIATLIVILVDTIRDSNGLPSSERYRQKFMRDC